MRIGFLSRADVHKSHAKPLLYSAWSQTKDPEAGHGPVLAPRHGSDRLPLKELADGRLAGWQVQTLKSLLELMWPNLQAPRKTESGRPGELYQHHQLNRLCGLF